MRIAASASLSSADMPSLRSFVLAKGPSCRMGCAACTCAEPKRAPEEGGTAPTWPCMPAGRGVHPSRPSATAGPLGATAMVRWPPRPRCHARFWGSESLLPFVPTPSGEAVSGRVIFETARKRAPENAYARQGRLGSWFWACTNRLASSASGWFALVRMLPANPARVWTAPRATRPAPPPAMLCPWCPAFAR